MPSIERKSNQNSNLGAPLDRIKDNNLTKINYSLSQNQLEPSNSCNSLEYSNLLNSEIDPQTFNSFGINKRKRSRYDKSIKRYKCQICEKDYLSLSALYVHKKSKHKNIIIEKRKSKQGISFKNQYLSLNHNNYNHQMANFKEESSKQKQIFINIIPPDVLQNPPANCLVPLKSLDKFSSSKNQQSSSYQLNSLAGSEDLEVGLNSGAIKAPDSSFHQKFGKTLPSFKEYNQLNEFHTFKSTKDSIKVNLKSKPKTNINSSSVTVKEAKEKEFQLPLIYGIKRSYLKVYRSIKHDFENDPFYNLLLISHEFNLKEKQYNQHHFKNYLKSPKKINNLFRNVDQYCCDNIFVKFLIQKSQKLTKYKFENYSIYIIRFRRFLNCLDQNHELKWELKEQDDPPNLCQNHDTIDLPRIANKFIENFYDFYNVEEEETEARKQATICIFDFLIWLYENDYTYYKTELKNAY